MFRARPVRQRGRRQKRKPCDTPWRRSQETSHAGVEYELTIDGTDVTCNCPGFEYRGQCRHARDLKTALAAGEPAPQGYRHVGSV